MFCSHTKQYTIIPDYNKKLRNAEFTALKSWTMVAGVFDPTGGASIFI